MEDNNSGLSPRVTSIVAYLFIIGTIIAIILNKGNDKTVSFHIRQGLGLGLTSIVISAFNFFPFIGGLIAAACGIVLLIMWIIGIMAAANDEEKTVPLLGEQFQEWFKSIS